MKMRRILSLLLALLMVISVIMSVGVSAGEVSPYKDVKVKRWSYPYIKYVTDNGLMNGTSADRFEPESTMTRAMVVTVLYRLEGEPEVRFQPFFADVKNGRWYSSAVVWAANNKIVNGKGDGKFAPMENVTREQLATIIKRYAEFKLVLTEERADIKGFSDYKKVLKYAREAMSWANAVGLIEGKSATVLAPDEGATREQFAKILCCYTEADFKYQLKYNTPAGYSTYTEKPYELVTDADIYVSVNGDNNNDGKTTDTPIATFERAVELVRALKDTKKTGEIKVAFMAGNYGFTDIKLTKDDSGTSEVPITYCAYGDGDVIFQNGFTITNDMFEALDEDDKAFFVDRYEGGIKKVELEGLLTDLDIIDKNSQLVNNGQRMNQARYPSKLSMGYDESYITDPVEGRNDKSVILTNPVMLNRIKNYHTLKNTEIIGYLAQPYMCNVQEMESFDPETGVITFTESAYQGTNNFTNQFTFFSNISEELDCANEYWVDVDGKTLYVYEPDTDYVLTTRELYIDCDADYVSFVGFEFCGSSGGFFDIDADHVTIKLCDMYVGGGLMAVMAKGTYLTVSECEFYNLAGGGILLEDELEKVNNIEANGSVIDNNSFHDYLLKYKVYLPAVRLYNTVGVRISHNEFYNAAHSAIQYGHVAEGNAYLKKYGGGRGIDNIIEYNVFHDLLDHSGDCGAIYSDRSVVNRDNIVRYNIFYNLAINSGAQMAIYYGDAVACQQVYGNVFYEAGTEAIRSDGRENKIYDNVYIEAGSSRCLTYGTKYRGMYIGDDEYSYDNLKGSPTWGTFYESFSLAPKAGTAAYAIWNSRWDKFYDIKTDMSRADELLPDPDFIINPSYCVIKNNYAFGADNDIEEDVYLFSEVENNLHFTLDENPIFVNPTLGDYSIREDADFFKIPYKEIGRY